MEIRLDDYIIYIKKGVTKKVEKLQLQRSIFE